MGKPKLQAGEGVIKTPFGKATISVEDEDSCGIYFDENECVVDGHIFSGRVNIVSGEWFSDHLYCKLQHLYCKLPHCSRETIINWCERNYKNFITPKLLNEVVIENLRYEIQILKDCIAEHLRELQGCKDELRQKQRDLTLLRKKKMSTTATLKG
jgi:hypothetical protein